MGALTSGLPPVIEEFPAPPVYVRSPLRDNRQLDLAKGRDVTICVEGPIWQDDYPLLSAFAAKHESVSVVLSTTLQDPNVAFLQELHSLRDLAIWAFAFSDFASLAQAPTTLKSLTLGPYGKTRQSLDFLNRFPSLEALTVTEYSKDIEAIASLRRLRYLHLHKVKFADLRFLGECTSLLELRIWLGSLKSLEGVSAIQRLRFLELRQIRDLSTIGPLASATHLQYLALENLPHVASLPSFAGSESLRRVSLLGLPGLGDLSSLAQAPRIEELVISGKSRLSLANLQCLKGHPTLRAASFGFGSRKQSYDAQAFLSLPDIDGHFTYAAEPSQKTPLK